METKNYGWPERMVVWGVSLFFLAAGGSKLAGMESAVDVFHRFGLPLWFMYLTAAIEIAGALLLHVRRYPLGLAAPVVLGVTMIVGAGLHLTFDPPMMAAPAIVLTVLLAIVAFMRLPQKST